uniref:Uncharacterized protein n=1 Tax=Avena sativa TaxID=4498 RepID=A0ACD6AU54_AVESA
MTEENEDLYFAKLDSMSLPPPLLQDGHKTVEHGIFPSTMEASNDAHLMASNFEGDKVKNGEHGIFPSPKEAHGVEETEPTPICLSDDVVPVPYPKVIFLDRMDILLAEHKIEEALLALEAEEKKYMVTDNSGKESDAEISAYKTALLKRKSTLEDQLVRYSEQPSLSITEIRKSLSGLIKIGKGSVAHQVLLKTYGSRLQKNIEGFLPTCSVYKETYSATLSQIVFSAISKVLKESSTLFGDSPTNMNRITQWAEYEIEVFARLVKENSPLLESDSALRSACICIQTTLAHCSCLESHGLKFSELLMVLLRPYIEEVLDLNFRRVRRKIIDSAKNDDILRLTPQEGLPPSGAVAPKMMLTSSGKNFMSIVNVSSPFIDYDLLILLFWIFLVTTTCVTVYEKSFSRYVRLHKI